MMKITVRFAVFSLVILFSIIACKQEPDENDSPSVPVYFGETMKITGERVWAENPEYVGGLIHRPKYTYIPFRESRANIFGFIIDEVNPAGTNKMKIYDKPIGKISDGILDLDVPPLVGEELLSNADLEVPFSFWTDVEISPQTVQGNWFFPMATDKEISELTDSDIALAEEDLLFRRGISGTREMLSEENILFFYFTDNCTITGKVNPEVYEARDYAFFEIDTPLNLKLRKGWNAICHNETYSVHSWNGRITYKVKNSGVRWVIVEAENYPDG